MTKIHMTIKDESKDEPQTVIAFFKEEGEGYAAAFGLIEIEISKALLLKHGKVISKSEPDIFNVFVNNVERKLRALLGI